MESRKRERGCERGESGVERKRWKKVESEKGKGGKKKKVRIKREKFYHHLPADLEEELSSRTTLRGRGGEKKGEGEERGRRDTKGNRKRRRKSKRKE